MRDLVRVNEARRAGVSPDHLVPRAARPVTPFDVQDRRFRLARSGSRLGAVDELLDDVTDLLQALLQENEALRSTAGTDDERTDR